MKRKIILPVIAFLSSIIAVVSAQVDDGCQFCGMMSGRYGVGMGLFGWIVGLLLIVILVLLIVWLIKKIEEK